jgi:deoxycytidylate deaminase
MLFGMNAKLSERLIKLAKAICPSNYELRSSHVAFLLRRSKIVKIGWNKKKSSPKNLDFPYHDGTVGIHAEMDVVVKQGMEDLSSYKMVVIRVDRNGNVSNSCPCVGCRGVIEQFNVGEVWYSDKNGKVVKM